MELCLGYVGLVGNQSNLPRQVLQFPGQHAQAMWVTLKQRLGYVSLVINPNYPGKYYSGLDSMPNVGYTKAEPGLCELGNQSKLPGQVLQ